MQSIQRKLLEEDSNILENTVLMFCSLLNILKPFSRFAALTLIQQELNKLMTEPSGIECVNFLDHLLFIFGLEFFESDLVLYFIMQFSNINQIQF